MSTGVGLGTADGVAGEIGAGVTVGGRFGGGGGVGGRFGGGGGVGVAGTTGESLGPSAVGIGGVVGTPAVGGSPSDAVVVAAGDDPLLHDAASRLTTSTTAIERNR